MQLSKIGFYFHIPFCPHICPYCDFIKTSKFTPKDITTYFTGLQNQLNDFLNHPEYQSYFSQTTHCTVYFGGGTPSLFSAKFYEPLIKKISERFVLEETSIETNPFTNRKNFISDYKHIGINRVTLGAQSLCPQILTKLGRHHSANDVLNNIKWLKKSGIEQVQIDLIYGLSQKRSIKIADEIKILVNAGATGISAYGLTIESRTAFGKSDNTYIDDETAVNEYTELLNTCLGLGLEQVETSNFSFYPAKHNQIYWSGFPYIGIGTGAHGLLPPTSTHPYGIRYTVGEQISEIEPGNDLLNFSEITQIEKNFKIKYESTRTKTEMIEELIFTLLRTKNGIPLDWLTSVLNNPDLVKEKILSQDKILRAIKEGKINLSKTHLILEPQEKIRGDAWALTLISCLL